MYVCVGEELEVYVIPFQVYELHAVTLDEPVLLLLIVMFIVCTESHPTVFVYVCVGEALEAYVIPFHE